MFTRKKNASVAHHWDSVYSEAQTDPRVAHLLAGELSEAERLRVLGNIRAGSARLNDALQYFGDLQGKRLLDIGCGIGKASLFFAAHGASVVSIDLSEVGIRTLGRLCEALQVDNVEPRTCSATDLSDLGDFDFAYGDMILHHIEPLDKFSAELRNAVKPGGRAFFRENSAASPLLIWFRRNVVGKAWVPKHGDHLEFPLTHAEIRTLRGWFEVERQHPEMFYFQLISQYLLRGRWKLPFRALDAVAQKLPALRKRSYHQYLYLA